MSFVRDGDMLLTPGGGNWKLNLTEGQPVRVRLRGKDFSATPQIIRDPDDVEPLLEKVTTANPMSGKFVRILRDDRGRFDRARLEAATRCGFAIVGWRLDSGGHRPRGGGRPAADGPAGSPRPYGS